jgi:hypothetical protein
MPSYVQFDIWQTTAGVNRNTVLQMQHVNTNFNESSSVTNPTLTQASKGISITPILATSKIFVFFDILMYNSLGSTTGVTSAIGRQISGQSFVQLNGNGYYGVSGHNIAHYSVNWNGNHIRVPWTVIDTPNTTSTITYYPMYGTYSGGTTYLGNGGNQYATMTVWEIAQ